MAFIAVPDTAMIELVYWYDNSAMENVFYYSGLNVDDAGVLQGLAENAYDMWYATFRHYQASSLFLIEVKATDLTQESGAVYEHILSGLNFGERPDQGLPSNCAALCSIKTAKRGKSYRGRVYIPGITEDQCSGSTLAAGLVTAFNGYFGNWDFLDVDGEPYGLQVVSRYHDKAPRTVGVHTDAVGWACKGTIASQRRRLPGRGG